MALALAVVAPQLRPATGTLVVTTAGRSAGTVPSSSVMIHGAGGWAAVGDIAGGYPAAPQEKDMLTVLVAAGKFDGVRVGGDVQSVRFAVTAGQVVPLLLGFEAGRLVPGGVYAGNDEVNLGLGELAGKFVAMADYALVDQSGKAFDPAANSGQDLVIAAFHTTCHETCPLYTALFFEIAKLMPPGVKLAEVTTDPGTDTSSVLADYARGIGALWTFATGSADALTSFWKPFGVALATGDTHISTLALVDRHGYVRLVYRGVPAVGSDFPPSLMTGLSAQGLHELASGGDGWGAPEVLQALLTIAQPQQPAPGRGGTAPAVDLPTTDGHKSVQSDLAGKPAVINFWASYCPPCKAEMPLLQREVGRQPGVQLVLINEGDSAQAARAFLESAGIHQAALLDSDLAVGRAYGVTALPMTVFVRADGTISGRQIGQLSEGVLAAQLSNLASQ
ncbi:MAG TPA: redoxin family protein [Candidatus Dormibacteraeota bacterium]|nr:redoxin family protein [Candidatus Dormibacteraeota bacterium]